jgi:hypothetical protein
MSGRLHSYRQKAAEYLELADTATDAEEQVALVKIAANWHTLVKELAGVRWMQRMVAGQLPNQQTQASNEETDLYEGARRLVEACKMP